MNAYLEYQRNLKELQSTFTEKQKELYSELESATNYRDSIEADYGNEAVFLCGVEVGLIMAGYGESRM